jgi:hypothetical membrane protein
MEKHKKLCNLKLAGFCGLTSFLILIICITITLQQSPWFNWTENWLSHIGGFFGGKSIWSARGITSIIFNFGLITAGIIGLIFSYIIKKGNHFKTKTGGYIPSFFSFSMIALTSCGIFPTTTYYVHVLFSILFLGVIPILLIFLSFEIKKLYSKKLWYFSITYCTILLFLLACFVLLPHFSILSKAIAEMILILSLYVPILVISLKIMFKNFPFRFLKRIVKHSLYIKKIFINHN